jgi:hypothetical protein
MIFTYKNKKYASTLKVATANVTVAKVPAKIKYNMFAAINNAGCNYCGTK